MCVRVCVCDDYDFQLTLSWANWWRRLRCFKVKDGPTAGLPARNTAAFRFRLMSLCLFPLLAIRYKCNCCNIRGFFLQAVKSMSVLSSSCAFWPTTFRCPFGDISLFISFNKRQITEWQTASSYNFISLKI